MAKRILLLSASGLAILLFAVAPGGAAPDEDRGREALRVAVERGRALWQRPWAEGQKACAECHEAGPNRLTGRRLKAYPRYVPALDRVVTGQQKLNQMIVEQARGEALDLGSDDLNALEAYVATRR